MKYSVHNRGSVRTIEADIPVVNNEGVLFLYGPLQNAERRVIAVFNDWNSCMLLPDSLTTQADAPMSDAEFAAESRKIIDEMERVAPPRVQSWATRAPETSRAVPPGIVPDASDDARGGHPVPSEATLAYVLRDVTMYSCEECGHDHIAGESCADAMHRMRPTPMETEYE